MQLKYIKEADHIIKVGNKDISIFREEESDNNKDDSVIKSFGEEWSKFDSFSSAEIELLGDSYFDILTDEMVNPSTVAGDFGGGTGRFSKYLADKVNSIEFVDPSDAVLSAARLLESNKNIRLTKASIGSLPFEDESFDFVMSIGVLHHIPDTPQAMVDCVKKVKPRGYFYTYLYYNLDNRGFLFNLIYEMATFVRRIVSLLPGRLKRFVCDLIAVFIYLPIILIGKGFIVIGLQSVAEKIPLFFYTDTSWNIIRNDALDRFGTTLEQRFSKAQIIDLMEKAGLENIIVSNKEPYWHAVGQKKVNV